MSGEKKYTQRELVLAEREAFMVGVGSLDQLTGIDAIKEAERLFPLPKVTRPRVVKDGDGIAWRVVDGRLEFERGGLEPFWAATDWYGAIRIGAERIRLWADLLANPTEEVEDDA